MRDLIAEEYSSRQMKTAVRNAARSRNAFDELARVFTGNDEELARRAAWAIGYAATQKPDYAQKHLRSFLKMLDSTERHPAIYRNIFRLLQNFPLPQNLKAQVFDLSIRYIVNASYPAAIRAFAMSAAFNAGKVYPELLSELKTVVQSLNQEESPAVKNRAGKILAKISRIR